MDDDWPSGLAAAIGCLLVLALHGIMWLLPIYFGFWILQTIGCID